MTELIKEKSMIMIMCSNLVDHTHSHSLFQLYLSVCLSVLLCMGGGGHSIAKLF